MGALTSKTLDTNYTSEMLAAELEAESVAIGDKDDLVDAFLILNGYAKAMEAAEDLEKPKGGWGPNGKPDPGKEIKAQATAQALALFSFINKIVSESS